MSYWMGYWATLLAKGGKLQEALMRVVMLSRKPYLALVLLATLLMTAAPMPAAMAQSAGGSVNSIAAVVNGDVVTRSEIESRRRLLALSAQF